MNTNNAPERIELPTGTYLADRGDGHMQVNLPNGETLDWYCTASTAKRLGDMAAAMHPAVSPNAIELSDKIFADCCSPSNSYPAAYHKVGFVFDAEKCETLIQQALDAVRNERDAVSPREEVLAERVASILARHLQPAAVSAKYTHNEIMDSIDPDFSESFEHPVKPAAVSADAVEVARLKEEFQIVANLGTKADIESAMLVAKSYGDACRLDGARKMKEACSSCVTLEGGYINAKEAIRALSPETVCGGE